MITAEQIANLAASLGTVEGLARVNAEMESLNIQLMNPQMDPQQSVSSDELVRMSGALESLNTAILGMDRVVRELLGQGASGAVDCVG